MRTYKSNRPSAEKTKQRMPKRGVQAAVISAAIIVIAVVLTLSLVFGLRKAPVENDVPIVTPPGEEKPNPRTCSAPLTSCTVIKTAALDKLVYNDTLKQWRTHNGVDFEAAAGSDVFTIASGTVTSVENTILDGMVVTVEHAEGYSSTYKGLEKAAVAKGDKIESGAKIGTVGNMMSEQNSGAHLHLEMKKDGKFVVVTDYINVENDK